MTRFATLPNRLTIALLATGLSFVLLSSGCQKKRVTRRSAESFTTATQDNREEGHLGRAIDYVERLYEFDAEMATTQAQYHLNSWLATRDTAGAWSPDPMSRRLPKEVRESDLLDDVDKLRFSIADTRALQEAVWCRNISRRVARESADERLAKWLRGRTPQLDEVDNEQLLLAERLFDWTIRNIQLEKTLKYPQTSIASPANISAGSRMSPSRLGTPGPGYGFHLWEVLLFGRGDRLDRSRVFLQLARQQGIEVVLLAFPGNSTPPRPEVWLTGALIGDEVFLFDCELGLAVPTEDGGIVTLAEVIAKPDLLSVFDEDDETYAVEESELKQVLALVDAAPTALSRRMSMVEKNLAGQNRLALTAAPTAIGKRLREQTGLAKLNIETRIWRAPYELLWFKESFAEVLEKNQNLRRAYLDQYGIFQSLSATVRGRILHIVGKIEDYDGDPGAKSYYMQSRLPQAAIDIIETNQAVQEQIGLVRGPTEKEWIWQFKLQNARMLATQSKQHSSYWLGIALFEGGRYDGAIRWFDDRTLQAAHHGPWDNGARYNLARTLEAMGEIDKAVALYSEKSRDPQGRGNRLRARLLKPASQPTEATGDGE